jgi:hypothetical protein
MSNPSNHLKDHVKMIAKHEEEFLARRTTSERVGDLLGALSSVGAVFRAVISVSQRTLANADKIPRSSHEHFPQTVYTQLHMRMPFVNSRAHQPG